MDIALCYESVLPARGGAETYIGDLARRLARDGHAVHLFAADWDASALPATIIYHKLPKPTGPRFVRPWRFAHEHQRRIDAAHPKHHILSRRRQMRTPHARHRLLPQRRNRVRLTKVGRSVPLSRSFARGSAGTPRPTLNSLSSDLLTARKYYSS